MLCGALPTYFNFTMVVFILFIYFVNKLKKFEYNTFSVIYVSIDNKSQMSAL